MSDQRKFEVTKAGMNHPLIKEIEVELSGGIAMSKKEVFHSTVGQLV